jgi:alkane 1-monooxygenase
MKIKTLKYLLAFSIPLLFSIGVAYGGWLTFGALIFAFGVIPLLELLFKPDARNLQAAELEMRSKDRLYDFLLYLIVPVVYGCVALYLFALSKYSWQTFELIGLTASLVVVLGGMGINVAHELGHRQAALPKVLSKMLLLPTGYMHFYIEHNYGHHKNVSTHEDPASARYRESLYHFWLRSVVHSYLSAWTIERKRLERKNLNFWGIHNEMIRFQMIQLGFWTLIFIAFGWKITLAFTIAAVGGFLLLETVNYIEHYGLARQKLGANRYERVRPAHSWNSNHVVGRLMLFELSRHSDHHFQPAKKYQLLDHHEDGPQMPTGYPGMMLLSAIPPLWHAVMDKRIPNAPADNHKSKAA